MRARVVVGLAWGAALAACTVPSFPPPDLSGATGDPERGRYLAEHVAVCVTCHSHRDWRFLYGPTDGPIGGGSGSTQLALALPPGTVLWSPNLTPTALAGWTDAEIARAITGGLRRDGSPLFRVMPFDLYGKMADDDVASLVAWMRALPPAPDEVPARVLPLPLAIGVRSMPVAAELVDAPPARGTAAYGAYLVNLASCVWCHSPVDRRSNLVPGRELSGGHAFPVPPPGAGQVYAPNLTPDPATGIGAWTREAFIGRFRGVPGALRVPVADGGFGSPMPWLAYGGMDDEDLGAIYDWLRTVPPVENAVPRHVPPE